MIEQTHLKNRWRFFLIWAKVWLHFLKAPWKWKTNLLPLMKRKHDVIENAVRNYSSLILQVCDFPGSWSPIDFCTPSQVLLNVSKMKFNHVAISCMVMLCFTIRWNIVKWIFPVTALPWSPVNTGLCCQKLINHRPIDNWDCGSLLLRGQCHQRRWHL